MSKFRKKVGRELPAISTASLPDIVFMILFFFMVSTTMREVTYMVKITLPTATELSKLEKKSLVSYIYVGEPLPQYQKTFGVAPRIQLNDQFADVADIQDFIIAEREARNEAERPLMITSLKVDENTKMGIVTDIKQELRKSAALHINYSSRQRVAER
jgi:biopolymer transport protein ExbD